MPSSVRKTRAAAARAAGGGGAGVSATTPSAATPSAAAHTTTPSTSGRRAPGQATPGGGVGHWGEMVRKRGAEARAGRPGAGAVLRTVLCRAAEELSRRAEEPQVGKELLRLAVQHADLVDFPGQVFEALERHGLGVGLALFYEAHALHLEKTRRHAEALAVYELGVQRRAAPLARLEGSLAKFQQRMVKRREREALLQEKAQRQEGKAPPSASASARKARTPAPAPALAADVENAAPPKEAGSAAKPKPGAKRTPFSAVKAGNTNANSAGPEVDQNPIFGQDHTAEGKFLSGVPDGKMLKSVSPGSAPQRPRTPVSANNQSSLFLDRTPASATPKNLRARMSEAGMSDLTGDTRDLTASSIQKANNESLSLWTSDTMFDKLVFGGAEAAGAEAAGELQASPIVWNGGAKAGHDASFASDPGDEKTATSAIFSERSTPARSVRGMDETNDSFAADVTATSHGDLTCHTEQAFECIDAMFEKTLHIGSILRPAKKEEPAEAEAGAAAPAPPEEDPGAGFLVYEDTIHA